MATSEQSPAGVNDVGVAQSGPAQPRLDFSQLSLLRDGRNSYESVKISESKYADVVRGRNRFFAACVGSVVLFMAISAIPQARIYGSLRHMYKRYCRAKVLDLTPKIADDRDVALYEMSKAVRVEFMVEARVHDDGRYKLDESLPEAEQAERRRAMTLDFMTKNDHRWVGSEVTFALVERKEALLPDFKCYDTVIIRNELLNRKETEARALLNSAVKYVANDGHVLLMDFGKCHVPFVNDALRQFNRLTDSSMDLTHDYLGWVKHDGVFDVVECRRRLLGAHYAISLQKRRSRNGTDGSISG